MNALTAAAWISTGLPAIWVLRQRLEGLRRFLMCGEGHRQKNEKAADPLRNQRLFGMNLVAGTGFEPVTFGL
jgi:hypothetical protein